MPQNDSKTVRDHGSTASTDEKPADDSSATGLSRRRTLGLAGLVGLGGLLGTASTDVSASTDGDVSFGGNDLVDVGGLQGGLTDGTRLQSLAGENLEITDGQLGAAVPSEPAIDPDLEARLDAAVTRQEVVAGTANRWRVGPAEPIGEYHLTGPFGLRFETDRTAYLGECRIDADAAGQITAALYEYDAAADAFGEQVDTTTIRTTGGQQAVVLDFLVDEPGQYLLTRLLPREPDDDAVPDDLYRPEDDAVELRRGPYDGFDGDSKHGLTLDGGYNPAFSMTEPNHFQYYYHDLELSSAERPADDGT